MATLQTIQDFIRLNSKEEVLKFHLTTKFTQKGIKATSRELDVLVLLYLFGGYNEQTENQFFEKVLQNNSKTTTRTIMNTISKFVKKGVIVKNKKKNRFVSEEYIPPLTSDIIGLHYKIINGTS